MSLGAVGQQKTRSDQEKRGQEAGYERNEKLKKYTLDEESDDGVKRECEAESLFRAQTVEGDVSDAER